jgi:hypothetical protein
MLTRAVYVLYLEHDNRPHNVWVFHSLNEADLCAATVARDIWTENEGDEASVPEKCELSDYLAGCGEHFRLYHYEDGTSEEVNLPCFENPQTKAA